MPNASNPIRLAIVGVGQVLLGDDGAGPAVIELLRQLVAPSPNLLLVDAGHAPENVFGPVIRFAPTQVIYIDAIRSNGKPGAIRWLRASDVEETGGSTHMLSLGIMADYIQANTSAEVVVAGIQPNSMRFSEGLSPEVQRAVHELAEELAGYWRKATTACSAITAGGVSVVSN